MKLPNEVPIGRIAGEEHGKGRRAGARGDALPQSAREARGRQVRASWGSHARRVSGRKAPNPVKTQTRG